MSKLVTLLCILCLVTLIVSRRLHRYFSKVYALSYPMNAHVGPVKEGSFPFTRLCLRLWLYENVLFIKHCKFF